MFYFSEEPILGHFLFVRIQLLNLDCFHFFLSPKERNEIHEDGFDGWCLYFGNCLLVFFFLLYRKSLWISLIDFLPEGMGILNIKTLYESFCQGCCRVLSLGHGHEPF